MIARMRFTLSSLVACSLLSVGCYTSHGLGSGEGGPVRLDGAMPRSDGGPVRDGGIVRLDAAPPIRRDGGPPRTDSGPPIASCESEVIGPYEGAPCRPETRDCLSECADDACARECYDADRDCSLCINHSLVHCANEEGCADAWHVYACCAEDVDACAGLRGIERLACGESCPSELDAYGVCLSGEPSDRCGMQVFEACGLF
jgi:hypothetical protein